MIYLYAALRNEIYFLYFKLKIMKNDGIKEYFRRKKEINLRHIEDRKQYEFDKIKKEKEMQMDIPITKIYECYDTTAMCLLSGIMANLQERQFYKKTKNVFVMPTYFSLFGFLNIQKRGEQIDFWDSIDVWYYIHDNSQNHHQPFCDGHTLSETDNFCLDNGHLKMVDYGSRSLEPFLEKNGEKLYSNFKIPE
ncbi:MAG: hypothetical protein UV95_C0002G0021 [Candidatus Falkowbacteria bacterium GW2011_GWF2_43_32]|nr:MAG: hypothetical protein UV95_C0002G0021 [Candidatus Falkowbacteria bacterium GW2011_GWF2_43_32]